MGITVLVLGGAGIRFAVSSSSGDSVGESLVTVTLSDFTNLPDFGWAVNTDLQSVPKGKVVFDVSNVNSGEPDIPHNLVVIRSDLAPDQLPRLGEGLGVDESKVEVVGSTPFLDSGQKGLIDVELEAGNYVLICNVSPLGIDFNSHYEDGMFVGFSVTEEDED